MTVPGSMVGSCMACRSAIANVDIDGERVQLDYGASKEPRAGLVAINPIMGTAKEIGEADLPSVKGWRAKGVTLHQRHAEVCIGRLTG